LPDEEVGEWHVRLRTGYRRGLAQLHRWGVEASPELVRQLMRELSFEFCQPHPKRFSLPQAAVGTDTDLVGAITYVETGAFRRPCSSVARLRTSVLAVPLDGVQAPPM
jgi:hypothetical protein